MFPGRLSEVLADDIKAIIESEAAEGPDFELKRELPVKRGQGQDPWMTGGRISDYAKDVLAAEIIAFANAGGGTLIVGINEDKATKRAILPLAPIPRCKEAAERLHQAIGDRIEPRLPVFECEGIVTEGDGSSGVIVMRTLQSYLAPHRHTQSHHCYIRRQDRAEPMSMEEIRELARRADRGIEEVERAFARSADRFYSWIPEWSLKSHPARGIQGMHQGNNSGTTDWIGMLGMRLTARPLAPLPTGELPKQPWLSSIDIEQFDGSGRQGNLACHNIDVVRAWQPRLRAVEREFRGKHLAGLDRIGAGGQIDRYIRSEIPCYGQRPKHLEISLVFLVWNVASVIRVADIVRSECYRPTQSFAFEVELSSSDQLVIFGYPGPSPSGVQKLPAESIVFPRYEIGAREEFDMLLTTFDRDVWNAAGYHPDWELSVTWPPAKVR